MVAKVSVSSHVVVEIIKSGKMYDESVDLQTVIKSTMVKAAAEAGRNLSFVKAEAYTAADAMDRCGILLDSDDLPDMAVKDLRDHFGTFLKLRAEYAEEESGATLPWSSTGSRVALRDAGCIWRLSLCILRIRVSSAARARPRLLSMTVLSTPGLQSQARGRCLQRQLG